MNPRQKIKELKYQCNRIGNNCWEAWDGHDYVCMLSFDAQTKKWAATHNLHPQTGSSDYRYGSPQEAIAAYSGRTS